MSGSEADDVDHGRCLNKATVVYVSHYAKWAVELTTSTSMTLSGPRHSSAVSVFLLSFSVIFSIFSLFFILRFCLSFSSISTFQFSLSLVVCFTPILLVISINF